jgi:transposase
MRGRHNKHVRGERHYKAKLTPEKVRLILSGRISQSALAERFNVHWSTISDCQRRKTWRHISNDLG